MDSLTTTLMPPPRTEAYKEGSGARISDQLLDKGGADHETVLKELASRLDGLTQVEADTRLKQVGPNEIAREKHQSALMRLLSNVKNPLVLLLAALGVLSYLTGDLRATAVIFVMVVQGVVLRFVQEMRADTAAKTQGDGQQYDDVTVRGQGSRGTTQTAGARRHRPFGGR